MTVEDTIKSIRSDVRRTILNNLSLGGITLNFYPKYEEKIENKIYENDSYVKEGIKTQ